MANRSPRHATLRTLVAATVVLLAGAGFSAGAGLSRQAAAPPPIVADGPPPSRSDLTLARLEPGSAPLPAVAGATGTTALPAVPVPVSTPADPSVHAAQPFVPRGSALDNLRALECLTSAIYYEAATEPADGQAAVAQVVLNRVRHPAFPDTVCGVVYQGSERAGCQFSFACDGAVARMPVRAEWDRARGVAARALAGAVFAPVGLATHYHRYAVRPAWQKTLVMTGVFGAHFFHRWQGWWGTPAAFSQRYLGNEPAPGPHPRVDAPVPMPVPIPVVAGVVAPPLAKPTTPAAGIVAAHLQSGSVRDDHAEESQILDRWKDSGKPLR